MLYITILMMNFFYFSPFFQNISFSNFPKYYINITLLFLFFPKENFRKKIKIKNVIRKNVIRKNVIRKSDRTKKIHLKINKIKYK